MNCFLKKSYFKFYFSFHLPIRFFVTLNKGKSSKTIFIYHSLFWRNILKAYLSLVLTLEVGLIKATEIILIIYMQARVLK